jgi:hypothetical protein
MTALVALLWSSYALAMYHPGVRRFMHRDHVQYLDDYSLYQYVRSNPSNGWDPTGLNTIAPPPISPSPVNPGPLWPDNPRFIRIPRGPGAAVACTGVAVVAIVLGTKYKKVSWAMNGSGITTRISILGQRQTWCKLRRKNAKHAPKNVMINMVEIRRNARKFLAKKKGRDVGSK